MTADDATCLVLANAGVTGDAGAYLVLAMTPLARSLLARVPPGLAVPPYGSPAWDALEDQDPRRAAAVIIAAECWRDHCSSHRVAEDMRRLLAEEDDAVRRRIREASWDVAAARDWAAIAARPTYAELVARRSA